MPNNEKRKELTKQIIIRVKEVIKDLTDAEVLEKMVAAGEPISLSTVRRFRAPGSEDTGGFNYNLTVKPFARVFLELNDKPVSVEALTTEEDKDRAALDNMIQIKNIQIESLEAQIALLKEELLRQNKLLDERRDFIHDLQRVQNRFRKTTIILVGLLFLCLVVVIIALATDAVLPL